MNLPESIQRLIDDSISFPEGRFGCPYKRCKFRANIVAEVRGHVKSTHDLPCDQPGTFMVPSNSAKQSRYQPREITPQSETKVADYPHSSDHGVNEAGPSNAALTTNKSSCRAAPHVAHPFANSRESVVATTSQTFDLPTPCEFKVSHLWRYVGERRQVPPRDEQKSE